MFNRYQIGVEITGDAGGLKRATKDAERHLRSLGNLPPDLKNQFDRLGDSFLRFSRMAALAGTAGFAYMLKQGTSLALATKLNEARFTQLGASAEERNEIMRRMGEVSRECAVSMGDLTNSAIKFYSSGIKSSDALVDNMTMINDAALFSGKSFNEMGYFISKALSAGYMDLYEFWQLNERGIITLNDLIGILGDDIEEVMNKISDRQLTTEIATDIILKKTGGFIEKAKTDLGVAIQLFKNAWSASQERFATGFYSGLFAGLDEQEMSEKITNFARALPEKMEEIGRKAGEALRKIFDFIKENKDAIKVILEIVAALWAAAGVLRIIALVATPVHAVIGLIAAALVLLAQNWGRVKEFAIDCWDTIRTKCSECWDKIKGFGQWIWDNLVGVWDVVRAAAVGCWEKITGAATAAWEKIKGIGQDIKNIFSGAGAWGKPNDMLRFTRRGRAAGTPGFLGAYNHLRGYADGGIVRVNERGGEIIALPNGSLVIPHDYSNKLMSNRAGFDYDIFNSIIQKNMNKVTDRIVEKLGNINISVEEIQNGNIFKV